MVGATESFGDFFILLIGASNLRNEENVDSRMQKWIKKFSTMCQKGGGGVKRMEKIQTFLDLKDYYTLSECLNDAGHSSFR